jgi:hypothetical protein
VATSVVVGSVFLASNELFRMEQLSVGSRANFIDDRGFQINKDCARNVLASVGFYKDPVKDQ